MEAIIGSLITAAAGLGSVWLSHHLAQRRSQSSEKDQPGAGMTLPQHQELQEKKSTPFFVQWALVTAVAVVADFFVFEAWNVFLQGARGFRDDLMVTQLIMATILAVSQWILLRRYLRGAWLWIPGTMVVGVLVVRTFPVLIFVFGLANLTLGPILVALSRRNGAG